MPGRACPSKICQSSDCPRFGNACPVKIYEGAPQIPGANIVGAAAKKAAAFEGPPNGGGPMEPSALTRKPGVSSGMPTRKPGMSRVRTKLNMLQFSSLSVVACLFMGDRSKATHY